MILHRLLAAIVPAVCCLVAGATDSLPKAPVRHVEETFFGTRVSDPYRYFEDIKNPEVAAWLKTHSDHAHRVLEHIAGRPATLAKLEAYDAAAPSRVTGAMRVPGDLWFYEKRRPQDNQYKLYMRHGLSGAEVLLVDPDAIAKRTGKPHAINYFAPSHDGRYVAYGVSKQGSESADLFVLDTRTLRPVGKPVSRADFGSPDWAPDSRSFQFVRLQELKPGLPATGKSQ